MVNRRQKDAIQAIRACALGVAFAGLVCGGAYGRAQSAAPAPDAPNSPVAVPPEEQPAKDPRILIQTQMPAADSAAEADRTALHARATGAPRPVNRRLILTDGTFQLVRSYQIVGDRVRYFSVDREDWEELPSSLVDWKATHAWEADAQNQNATTGSMDSDAMREAAQLDREEAAQRTQMDEAMPEVVPGLRLPDRDGVFALDEFAGHPELVEISALPGTVNRSRVDRLRSMLPLAGQQDQIDIDGAMARVQLHTTQPQIYLSLDEKDATETAPMNAVTVPTRNAVAVENHAHGAASPDAGFALVRVEQRRAMRIIGNIRVSATGKVTETENVQPVKSRVLPGDHWLRITPVAPLRVGEYALVQILSPTQLGDEVWDFSIHPAAPENPSVIVPIAKR